MKDWQRRVLRERVELTQRLTKLASFISRRDPAFVALSRENQELLRRQRDAMMEYDDALRARIERFQP